jgi:hypothetical protein
MVWYAANGFAARIAMPFKPLLAVQPVTLLATLIDLVTASAPEGRRPTRH